MVVQAPNWMRHRSKELWGPDVDEWDPDRDFTDIELGLTTQGLPMAGYNPSTPRFSPFTYAPRDCMGKNFAQMEMRVILCHLFHHFEFGLDGPSANYDPATFYGVNRGTMGPERLDVLPGIPGLSVSMWTACLGGSGGAFCLPRAFTFFLGGGFVCVLPLLKSSHLCDFRTAFCLQVHPRRSPSPCGSPRAGKTTAAVSPTSGCRSGILAKRRRLARARRLEIPVLGWSSEVAQKDCTRRIRFVGGRGKWGLRRLEL